MRDFSALDGVVIVVKTSCGCHPPGFGENAQHVGMNKLWLSIDGEWYSWGYSFGKLEEALNTAKLFTVAEFLELHQVDLNKFEE
jgi:hypothetical protein